MSVSIFDDVLGTPAMTATFGDGAIVQAMLRFEAALAAAQAEEGLIPTAAALAIAGACDVRRYDIPALAGAGRRAGSLAIPLVKELTRTVARGDEAAAHYVHWGSTSQDVVDTALVLATRAAVALLDAGLAQLVRHLLALAERHVATPVLARTLMQPAQVTSFGYKVAGWAAPLLRARARLRDGARRALQLQLGGAVGTLAVMGNAGDAVVARMARALGLKAADAPWHTQRDDWVRLGLEVAVLAGSLGKIATDLALMAQGEVGELAEPSGQGRGGSSAMPHKRNPVSAMVALAAARRTPQRAAALLAAMDQQHERGLGNWQAELAEWPALFISAHGALQALNEAFDGLAIDAERMRTNIDAQQGLIYAEALAARLAAFIGRPAAHAFVEELARHAVRERRPLQALLPEALARHDALRGRCDATQLRDVFDPVAAAAPAHARARRQLADLQATLLDMENNDDHTL